MTVFIPNKCFFVDCYIVLTYSNAKGELFMYKSCRTEDCITNPLQFRALFTHGQTTMCSLLKFMCIHHVIVLEMPPQVVPGSIAVQ